MATYEDAVVALHQAPFADFVAERKRLAAALKSAGNRDGAAQLGKLPRPPVSAWAVNQLWWKERQGFERLIALAARVKAGEREASKAHREQLAQLREQAAQLLREAGNAAAEATLRRVTMTLSALAAQGGFSPDPPGALSADRDPPGFEALGGGASVPARATAVPAPAKEETATAAAREAEAEERRLEAERRRAEEAAAVAERGRRARERARLSSALGDARAQEAARKRDHSRLQQELEAVEQSLEESKALLERLENELASL